MENHFIRFKNPINRTLMSFCLKISSAPFRHIAGSLKDEDKIRRYFNWREWYLISFCSYFNVFLFSAPLYYHHRIDNNRYERYITYSSIYTYYLSIQIYEKKWLRKIEEKIIIRKVKYNNCNNRVNKFYYIFYIAFINNS